MRRSRRGSARGPIRRAASSGAAAIAEVVDSSAARAHDVIGALDEFQLRTRWRALLMLPAFSR